MLRIHTTREDLARIRLADRPDPLWETVLSCHRLRDRRNAHVYDPWRAETRRRTGGLPVTLRALIPPAGYFPDFLNPPQSMESWDDGLEALRATPRRRLRAEIERLDPCPGQPPPGWLRALAGGDREAVERLADDLDRYHAAAIATGAVWPRVQAAVAADRAARVRDLLAGGTEGLLAGLRPVLRWNPPVLEADYPRRRELRLDGRGLLLIPSYFCSRCPVTYFDDRDGDLTPVLVYPIEHPARAAAAEPAALGRLLGGTRARVLRRIEDGATTAELACRAGVSVASASQHATVLRDAGLVTSVRRGNHVLHTVTPLGVELLSVTPRG